MNGLDQHVLLNRLHNSWSVDEAISVFMDHAGTFCGANRHGIYLRHTSVGEDRSAVRGVSDQIVVDYERYGRTVDPVLKVVLQTHAPTTESMALSTEWKRSELYQRVCKKYGNAHIMTAPIIGAAGALIGTMQFARTAEFGEFKSLEIQRAQALTTHLSQRISTLLIFTGVPSFTQRESEIVACLVDGKSTVEIASALHVSLHAVRQAVKRMFAKYEVHSRAQLVALALRGTGTDRSRME